MQHTAQISGSPSINPTQNRISLIFRLPSETLESIFIYCARDYHYRVEDSFLHRATPRWVHVSYVCRRWRSISLNCPIMWTYLFETSPRWTEEILSRSKRAPLKLRVDMNFWDSTHNGLRFVEQVMTHVERLQEFRIRLSPRINPAYRLFSVLSLPAPCLRSLTFLPPYLSSSCAWPSSAPFRGDTPALRTLKLARCALPWYSLTLGGLTTLDLSYIPRSHRQPIEDFLSTLRCMKDLVHLYLEHAIAGADTFPTNATLNTLNKINLPHLCRLFIHAPLSTLVTFLSCVTFPSTTEVRIGCKSEYDHPLDDYLHLSSLVTQRYQCFDYPTIRSLTIRFDRNNITLTFSSSEQTCNISVFEPPMDWANDIPLQVFIRSDPPMTTRYQDLIVRDICCNMPLTKVRTAYTITPPFSSSFWRHMLGYLPELRHLKLGQGRMPNLPPVLLPTSFEDTAGGGRLAVMLEQLELYNIVFSSPSDTEELKKQLPPAAGLDSLCDTLSACKGSGGQLTLSRCVVGQSSDTEQLNMVGKWGGGQFHVMEERRRPNDSAFGPRSLVIPRG